MCELVDAIIKCIGKNRQVIDLIIDHTGCEVKDVNKSVNEFEKTVDGAFISKTSYKKNITELQKRLLELLSWFHDFCVQHNLRYYILGGTFLGAVRHNGFIPWDDDADVGMPRPDYEKLIEIFKIQGSIDNYFFESTTSNDPNYLYTYGKLYDINTTLVEKLTKPFKRGIFLDVFPIDGVGNSIKEAKKYYKKIDRLNLVLTTRMVAVSKHRKIYKNMAILLMQIIPNMFIDNKKLALKIDEICKSKDYNTCSYVCNCASTYRAKEIIEKKIIDTFTLYKFESIYLYGPENYEAYLEHIYGNWRCLPPKEKQITNHNYLKLDLNRSWIKS